MQPWFIRPYRLRTARALLTSEGGFAILYSAAAQVNRGAGWRAGAGFACVPEADGFSGLLDLLAARQGENIVSDPNSNLLFPNTVIPSLRADLQTGEHWLAAAVLGHRGMDGDALFRTPPSLVRGGEKLTLRFRGRAWEIAVTGGRSESAARNACGLRPAAVYVN